MNPVVGLDLSKGESQVQAFLDKGQPYGKSFSISHTREGLDTFLHILKNEENITGQLPLVVLESTGHYFCFWTTIVFIVFTLFSEEYSIFA